MDSTGGKPKGFLIDTFGIYSAVFSPVYFYIFCIQFIRICSLQQKA